MKANASRRCGDGCTRACMVQVCGMPASVRSWLGIDGFEGVLHPVRRIVAPMSNTEKQLNKQLLEKVQQAGLASSSKQPQPPSGNVVRTKSAAAKTAH